VRLARTALARVAAHSRLSTDKIRSVLGFRPRYTFGSAIDELRAWYAATRSTEPAIGPAIAKRCCGRIRTPDSHWPV
jgi:hypothetical protein